MHSTRHVNSVSSGWVPTVHKSYEMQQIIDFSGFLLSRFASFMVFLIIGSLPSATLKIRLHFRSNLSLLFLDETCLASD